MRKAFLTAVVLVPTLLITGLIADRAEARPKYLGVFMETYPALKPQAAAVKCGVCHPQPNKAIRNEYGEAVGKGLTIKNEKLDANIQKALQGAEAAPSPNGGTFGNLIQAGQLPN